MWKERGGGGTYDIGIFTPCISPYFKDLADPVFMWFYRVSWGFPVWKDRGPKVKKYGQSREYRGGEGEGFVDVKKRHQTRTFDRV